MKIIIHIDTPHKVEFIIGRFYGLVSHNASSWVHVDKSRDIINAKCAKAQAEAQNIIQSTEYKTKKKFKIADIPLSIEFFEFCGELIFGNLFQVEIKESEEK